jgi:hypothetical protein
MDGENAGVMAKILNDLLKDADKRKIVSKHIQ